MSDSHDDDLARRIRQLISEAGAEAPIANGSLPTTKVSTDEAATSFLARKGLLVGAVTIAAALAAVAVLLIREPDAPSLEPVVPTSGAATTIATTSPPTTQIVDTTVAASTTAGVTPSIVDVPGRPKCTTWKQHPGFGDIYTDVLACFDTNFGSQLVIDSTSLWRAGSTSDGEPAALFHYDASLKPLGSIPIPATVLAMATDRGSMWAITNKAGGSAAQIIKVDLTTGRVLFDHALSGTIIPDGPVPASAVVIDGNDVWLTVANGPAMIIHYQTDGTYVGTIKVAAPPIRMVALAGHLYALTNTGDVLAIDTTTKAVTSLAKLPAPTTFVGAIAAAGDDLWVDTTELIHIDLSTGNVTDRSPALISDLAADPQQPGRAWAAPFEPDPKSVPGTGAGSVVRLSLHGVHPDGTLHFETLMTNGIDELAFTNDGTLYGSNGYSGQLVRIGLPQSATPSPTTSTCTWKGAVVNGDGAGQHIATVLGFTNTSPFTCKLPTVEGVLGVRSSGPGTVTAQEGAFFPIQPAAATVVPGDRVELVLSTTQLDLCQPNASVPVSNASVPLSEVKVSLSDGSVIQIPVDIEAGCGISFSQLGSWG